MNTVNSPKKISIQGPNSLQNGPEIFIADWLSCHNHKENIDEPIQGIDIRVDTIQSMTDILECIIDSVGNSTG